MKNIYIPPKCKKQAKSQARRVVDFLNGNDVLIEPEIKEPHELRKASLISLVIIVVVAVICWSALL